MATPRISAFQKDVMNEAIKLEKTLSHCGISAKVLSIETAAETRRFEMELEPDLRLQKIVDFADEIAIALGVSGIHIDAPDSLRIVVGIEVPFKK